MVSTGHLPKFADEAYHIERDDLWAIPTAEVPLTSMWRDEILDEADLPLRLTAATACFRREAGAAGRDTRGLLRVHEFDKVEIFAYTTPEQAAERARPRFGPGRGAPRRARARVPGARPVHRRPRATRRPGPSTSRSTRPGCDQWLEVSSVSWFGDYQARRANVRYRRAGRWTAGLVHTLNGSALAGPRVWAALVENGRQADGSVVLPEALRPYFGGSC